MVQLFEASVALASGRTVAGVTTHRAVRVRAVIERPPAAPGCVPPFPVSADWWTGTLLAWRWVDRGERTWTAFVRYRREGLLYQHWVSGEIIAPAEWPDGGAAAAQPSRRQDRRTTSGCTGP